ncbi:hypothetical protein Acid345_2639 [Candidatus Koribacter versatilis Ellin345]|uniref:Uncharacterized protein n=1 Tax=Koribacter versatilis (strain Ellin345) TaxID=204669 RepID=Q1INB0_KORVE|nr:hypothetical protein [Candidatus Koribacter versatilis]ABF41640.1 hypothetical protein Acid345_2639 [Candidatus Koribacter versatilis Ellin345]
MKRQPVPLTRDDWKANAIGVSTIAIGVLIVFMIFWPKFSVDPKTSEHPLPAIAFFYAIAVALPSLFALYLWRNGISQRSIKNCLIFAATGAALFSAGRWMSTPSDRPTAIFKVEALGVLFFAIGIAEVPRLLWLNQSSERASLLGVWESQPGDGEGIQKYGRVQMRFLPNGQLIYTVLSDTAPRSFRHYYSVQGSDIVMRQANPVEDEKTPFAFMSDGALVLYRKGVKSQYRRI